MSNGFYSSFTIEEKGVTGFQLYASFSDRCRRFAQANPAATLAKVDELKKAGMKVGHDHDHSDNKK